jgi:heat shock protein HtpX
MANENFRTLIAKNKRNTVFLFLGFGVVFVGLGLSIGIVWGGYTSPDVTTDTIYYESAPAPQEGAPSPQPTQTNEFQEVEEEVSAWQGLNWPFAWSVAGFAAVIAFIFCLASYYGGSTALLGMHGAKEIQPSDDPQLYNVVEEMCLSGGLPIPKIYLIEDGAMNAFATGRDPKHAAVAITRGLREKLSRDELQGVMAHELSHVRHYDILYATLMAVLVGAVILLSNVFLRSLWFGGGRRRSNDNSGGGAIQVILLIVAILLAILAPILAVIIQMAMSRQREYLADAGAVELSRNPSGLAGALAKLSGDPTPLKNANNATAPMYIVQPVMAARGEGRSKRKSGLMDTHPPIDTRIERLQAMGA